jgi:hypothetical protein
MMARCMRQNLRDTVNHWTGLIGTKRLLKRTVYSNSAMGRLFQTGTEPRGWIQHWEKRHKKGYAVVAKAHAGRQNEKTFRDSLAF